MLVENAPGCRALGTSANVRTCHGTKDISSFFASHPAKARSPDAEAACANTRTDDVAGACHPALTRVHIKNERATQDQQDVTLRTPIAAQPIQPSQFGSHRSTATHIIDITSPPVLPPLVRTANRPCPLARVPVDLTESPDEIAAPGPRTETHELCGLGHDAQRDGWAHVKCEEGQKGKELPSRATPAGIQVSPLRSDSVGCVACQPRLSVARALPFGRCVAMHHVRVLISY
jgi:hypothetical protein